MIIVVIEDMQSFLLVLIITLFAFGDSFLTLSNGNPDASIGEDGKEVAST